jgi:hypothetical protein
MRQPKTAFEGKALRAEKVYARFGGLVKRQELLAYGVEACGKNRDQYGVLGERATEAFIFIRHDDESKNLVRDDPKKGTYRVPFAKYGIRPTGRAIALEREFIKKYHLSIEPPSLVPHPDFDTQDLNATTGRSLLAGSRTPRQPDPLKKAEVEKAAILVARDHFSDFLVDSVERDNVGWDLEAKKNDVTLLLEVKGLSGTQLIVELTPNEYKAMKSNHVNYRVCVITNVLDEKRAIHVFRFDPSRAALFSEHGKTLRVQEQIAAKLSS